MAALQLKCAKSYRALRSMNRITRKWNIHWISIIRAKDRSRIGPCWNPIHFASLLVEINTTNQRVHIYLLLLISMLWHRQAIFESKRDKLSSSAECRIRTQRVSETQSSADWMPADKPTELSRIKLNKLELDSPSLWSASIQPTWPLCHLAFAPDSSDIHICCC